MIDAHPPPIVPPRISDAGEPHFFRDPTIDRLIDTVIALGAELWVQKDRMRVVEALLAEKGTVTAAEIEAHRDSKEEAQRLAAERDAFVRQLYGSLTLTRKD